MADFDEPLSEATLSLHLRKLVQAEIDRSFKLGLTGTVSKPADNRANSTAQLASDGVSSQPCRRS